MTQKIVKWREIKSSWVKFYKLKWTLINSAKMALNFKLTRTHTSGKSLKADNLNTKGLLNKQIVENKKELISCNNLSFQETFTADLLEEARETFRFQQRVNLQLFWTKQLQIK